MVSGARPVTPPSAKIVSSVSCLAAAGACAYSCRMRAYGTQRTKKIQIVSEGLVTNQLQSKCSPVKSGRWNSTASGIQSETQEVYKMKGLVVRAIPSERASRDERASKASHFRGQDRRFEFWRTHDTGVRVGHDLGS